MHDILPTCCDWGFYRRERSCRQRNAPCATWRESACNWCAVATPHILAVENITARELDARISSNQVKRLTAEVIDQMPIAADVALAIKANLAVITAVSAQIELLEKRLQDSVKAGPDYGLVCEHPGHWTGAGNDHPVGNGTHRSFCQPWQLCLLCPLRR